jgi:uncharacterized protein YjbI with pentapeptide repeats
VQQEPKTTLGRALRLSTLLVPDRLLYWRLTNANQLVWTIRVLIILGLLIAIGSAYNKGLWDWLELLIAPAAIAVGIFLLTQAQQAREKHAEDERSRHEQEMEDRQREREREFENRRAQNTAVQAYINNMGTLMLEGDLRMSKEESDVRVLARARTLTVLEGLDADHKRFILQFLYESNLINHKKFVLNLGGISWEYAEQTGQRIIGAADFAMVRLVSYRLPNISLSYVDLRNVYFKYVDLHDACLQGADLRGATFWISNLDNAMLADAHLEEASLGYSSLEKANLRGAHLRGAHLHGANLSGADLSGAS